MTLLSQIREIAEQAEVEMPSEEDLALLQEKLPTLRDAKHWQAIADMMRQAVERYLEDENMPMCLAPMVASILATDGEPWALVADRITINATHGGRNR